MGKLKVLKDRLPRQGLSLDTSGNPKLHKKFDADEADDINTEVGDNSRDDASQKDVSNSDLTSNKLRAKKRRAETSSRDDVDDNAAPEVVTKEQSASQYEIHEQNVIMVLFN